MASPWEAGVGLLAELASSAVGAKHRGLVAGSSPRRLISTSTGIWVHVAGGRTSVLSCPRSDEEGAGGGGGLFHSSIY